MCSVGVLATEGLALEEGDDLLDGVRVGDQVSDGVDSTDTLVTGPLPGEE